MSPPALKPLPPDHPWRVSRAARATGLNPYNKSGVGLSTPAISRIIGIAPKFLGKFAGQALLEALRPWLEQAGGQLLPQDLQRLLEWLSGLYGQPLVFGGETPIDPNSLDLTTLTPGAGWTQVGSWSGLSGYSVQHRHGTSIAAFLKATQVVYPGTPQSQFQLSTDANAHTTRANNVSGSQTLLAAQTARQAWVMDLWQTNPQGAFVAPYAYSQWKHDGPAPTPAPFVQVTRTTFPAPVILPFPPAADPMIVPVGKPWVHLPSVNPFKDTKTGHGLKRPEGSESGYETPTAPKPSNPPSTVVITGGGPKPPTVVKTDPGGRTPPPPRSKPDKKGWVKGPVGVVMNIGLKMTEADDFVDSLFDALPPECKKGVRGMGAKLLAIYDCWESIDVPKAISNLIINEVEDQIIGRVNAAGSKGVKSLLGNRSSLGIYRAPSVF